MTHDHQWSRVGEGLYCERCRVSIRVRWVAGRAVFDIARNVSPVLLYCASADDFVPSCVDIGGRS